MPVVGSHAASVIDPVWDLLRAAYDRYGVRPTLLERDFNIPPLAELLAEIDHIVTLQQKWNKQHEIRVARSG